MKTACRDCPLRRLPGFAPMSGAVVAATEAFKRGEMQVDAGTPILLEGAASAQVYTVLQGMGLRYKTLETGRRQVLGFVFPGDFVGLQAAVMEEMSHSVDAATEMVLCVFDRADLPKLFRDAPARAFDITWLAAAEESFLGEAMATIGQRPARARVAWGLLKLLQRGEVAGLLDLQGGLPLPYAQRDFADALGLSTVHTNKMLARLRDERIATWRGARLVVHDRAALARACGTPPETSHARALI